MGTDFLYHNGIDFSKGHADWCYRFESCQMTFFFNKLQQIKIWTIQIMTKETHCLFLISIKRSLNAPLHTERVIHITAFVTPIVNHWLEQEIAQWVHQVELIRWPTTPLTHLKMYQERFIDYHHGACVIELPAVVGSWKYGHQLSVGEELIAALHNLM